MFLQPHHFQQEARHVEHLVDARARAAAPFGWGHAELVLDEGLLALGRLGIARASGVLPDGTPFSIPQLDQMPAPLVVPADCANEIVYLAAPLAREGATEVAFSNGGNGSDGGAEAMCRFRAHDEDLRDHTNAQDDPEPVQTGALALRLLRERDASDAFARLGVARVVERRADQQVVLDRGYVAPQFRIDASGQLSATASLLHGQVQQRAKQLAAELGQQLGHGVSELAEFLRLQSLNRAEPVLRQFAAAPGVHPRELHLALLQLAGDLATFSSESRMPLEYPTYRHDDLRATFAPLIDELRRLLSVVPQRTARRIELIERAHGVRIAVVGEAELPRGASLVLAANAAMPAEQLRTRFASQSTLGPVDRIGALVNSHLPGIAMRSLAVAPRQLPYHAGFHYFELDRSGELWKQVERAGALALFVAGDFPELELELWSIRQ